MLWSFKGHNDRVSSLAMHGGFLFSGSDDALVRMWNLVHFASPYELGVLRPPFATSTTGSGSPIVGVDVVPMRGLVVTAAADGSVLVWDYGVFEGSDDYDAYGKVVYRNKYVLSMCVTELGAIAPKWLFAAKRCKCARVLAW